MRKSFGQSLCIEIAPHALRLVRVHRWRSAPATVLASHDLTTAAHPYDAAAIAAALRALLGEHGLQGWPTSFVLADELVRLWRVTPPQGAARHDDLEAAASLRFQALYGEAPSAWQVTADWRADAPFFAAAVPRALLAALLGVAEECRLAVVAIEPRFVSAWNRWRGALKSGAWFGVVEGGLLTLAPVAQGTQDDGVRALRMLALPAGAAEEQGWLTQAVQREALLLDLAPPTLLQLGGAVPARWLLPATAGAAAAMASAASAANPANPLNTVNTFNTGANVIECVALEPQSARASGHGAVRGGRPARARSSWRSARAMRIDFAPASVRRTLFHAHPTVLALLALGAALCVTAGLGGARLFEQQQEHAARLRHLQERVAAMSARPAPVARVEIPAAQAAAVNSAILQLNLPWRELQDAVQGATPPTIALVALEPDARKQVLKITAEAQSSDAMVDYVAALKQQETFSAVALSRHEIQQAAPNRPLRFELEATWLSR